MKFLKKIAASLAISSVLLVSLAPVVMAQSVLDDIKGTLEGEGITVVDYSTPESAWGSLSQEWITYFSEEGYSNLGRIAGDLEDYFIGDDSLIALKRELAITVAAKSRLTNTDDIQTINNEIEGLEEDINNLENEAKDKIANIVDSSEGPNKEEGINMIFGEIEFYFNYKKWGRLPLRIIGILEAESQYNNLQAVLEGNNLSTPEGITELKEELAGLELIIDGATLTLSEDDIDLVVESTFILSSSGEAQIHQVGKAVADTIKNLAGALAVIWIIVAGARMIFAQGDETTITEQKNAILYGVIGLVAILLVDVGIDTLYGAAGDVRKELTTIDTGFSAEVYGVITFIKALVGTIAIMFIVLSGIKMLAAQGAEEELTKQKKAVLYVAAGLILLAIDEIIIDNFFIIPTTQSDQIKSSNINTVINTFGTVLQFILGFVGLIAFGALVYGGATMIMNYGNDEMVEKSKKIIKNAIIGILVILSAYTIVASLVVFK